MIVRPVARGGREGASPPLEIISPPLESAGLFFFFLLGFFFVCLSYNCLQLATLDSTWTWFNLIQLDFHLKHGHEHSTPTHLLYSLTSTQAISAIYTPSPNYEFINSAQCVGNETPVGRVPAVTWPMKEQYRAHFLEYWQKSQGGACHWFCHNLAHSCLKLCLADGASPRPPPGGLQRPPDPQLAVFATYGSSFRCRRQLILAACGRSPVASAPPWIFLAPPSKPSWLRACVELGNKVCMLFVLFNNIG